MFKKISVLTLLLLYLVTASGFALNLHYCGNILASVKIDEPAKKCGPVKMKCCHDKHVEIKVKDAHKSPSLFVSGKLFAVNLPRFVYKGCFFPIQEITVKYPSDRGPPDQGSAIPVFLKNRNFRI